MWYEDGALTDDGKVVVPIERAVHKIAHGVHVVSETARRVTFSDKMKQLVRAMTGFDKTSLIQTMYMLKQPKIGEGLHPHQDETYLHVTPDGMVFGVWLAMDDATIENGCLEFIPGSHQPPLTYFYERDQNGNSPDRVLKYTGQADYVGKKDDNRYVKVPVKAGSAVLIHGLVVHKSGPNLSQHPRQAFTFHVFDSENATWCNKNCFQERDDYKFWNFYDSKPE